ncbi:hypothetical protein FACS1894177_06440 [Bacteroidia bacterium]|nr:hypothetical protein FACS1894177_06440 [Bacteroidia bacterium]
MNWFECKVSYEKKMETGLVKKVTELYLVDALSHAEAEARIIEEMKPYISGEFSVSSVRRMKYTEIFFNESGDKYYKVVAAFITLNEKTGAECKTRVNLLAQAFDLKDAIKIVETGMKGTMADYEFSGLNETMIMDVFP